MAAAPPDTKLPRPRLLLTVVFTRIDTAVSERVKAGDVTSPKDIVDPVSLMLREAVVFWRHKSTFARDVETKHPSCPVRQRELIALTPGNASPTQLMEEDVVPSSEISGLPCER